jgi:hypothetical protein
LSAISRVSAYELQRDAAVPPSSAEHLRRQIQLRELARAARDGAISSSRDTQLSANKFYTLDKQHDLTKYQPSDFGLPGYLDQFCESEGGRPATKRF